MKDRSGFYPERGYRWWGKLFIISLLLVFMVGCGTLQFKMQVENKLVIAKESGYQLMFRALKEIPEGETKERLKVSAETEFTIIYKDLDNADLAIDAAYLKNKLYGWIAVTLRDFNLSLSEEDARLILKTQDFFALEGGYEATAEQRGIGMAFCDGVLEALKPL